MYGTSILSLFFCHSKIRISRTRNAIRRHKKDKGMTRHFLELVISSASEELESIEPEKISEDFVIIYMDGVYAVKGCIIVAKIGNKIKMLWRWK